MMLGVAARHLKTTLSLDGKVWQRKEHLSKRCLPTAIKHDKTRSSFLEYVLCDGRVFSDLSPRREPHDARAINRAIFASAGE